MYNNCIIIQANCQRELYIFYIKRNILELILRKSRFLLQNIIALPSNCLFSGRYCGKGKSPCCAAWA